MSWFVDNATNLSIFFGIVAAGLVVAWRFTARVKYLGYAGGVLALLGVVWLLTLVVPTDSRQIESNVRAMAAAVENGKPDDLFKHISSDFDYRGMKRDTLYEKARGNVQDRRVKEVRIHHFSVEDLSHARKFAKTRFRVTASAEKDFPFITEADFRLEGEQWKLKTLRFYDPVQSLREIDVLSYLR